MIIRQIISHGVLLGMFASLTAAGARYFRLNTDLHVRPGPAGVATSPSATLDGIDPYFGLRGKLDFSRRYFATLAGEYASFGLGARVDNVADATLDVQLSPKVTLQAGYRHVWLDYRDDDLRFKVRIHGPEVRLGYAF